MKKIVISILLITLISVYLFGFVKKYRKKKIDIENKYLWKIDEADDLEVLGDDKTGTNFSVDNQVVKHGDYSVKVVPSDDTDEAKVDLIITKEMLEDPQYFDNLFTEWHESQMQQDKS